MKKLALTLLMASAMSYAADVHFTWLLTFNTVPGLPSPDAPLYGAQVFMDSDNPKVTEFQITVVALMPNGDIVTKTGAVAREGKAGNVLYSGVYVAWLGPDPNFQVLSIQVKSVVGKSATKPFPGRDYSSDSAAAGGDAGGQ
jgi:hypothetical protein